MSNQADSLSADELQLRASSLYDWLRTVADEKRGGMAAYDPTPDDLEEWADGLHHLYKATGLPW